MTGDYNGTPYNYIQRIDYDFYEQRTYLLYGNKTETFYNYTPALRRLNNLNVKTSDGNDLFNNRYSYDKVGNVLGLSNSAGITANNMAGKYQHRFEYDNLNRLVGADGTFDGSMAQIASGNDANASYHLKMKYNDTHGILNKNQQHIKNGNAYIQNTYSNDYKYITDTHKVESIIDSNTGDEEHFKYDLNGNITKRDTNTSQRVFSWDESNRLRVVSDNHSMQHYIYDASGERVLKANSDMETVYENGTLVNAPGTVSINGYTSYPSAFMVITADGVYSKHYYAGSQRIVSRLGDNDASMFETGCVGCKQQSTNNEFDAKKLQQVQKTDLQSYADKLKRGTIAYKVYKPISLAEQEKALADENEDKVEARAPSVYPMYFYHPDHLGTSTALTDFNGNAYQFFLNLPFGETMAQQLGSNYYNSPYKFNGKELDEETGLYYYGARYFDPRISIFQSTDQMAEKYPSFNPYAYCYQNPINFIDPTGMEGESSGRPLPFKKFVLPNFSTEWNDLDKSTLFNYVKSNFCQDCSNGKVNQMAGSKFENAFNDIMKKQLSNFNYKPNKLGSKDSGTYKGKTRNVTPDGKFDLIRDKYLKLGPVPTPFPVGEERYSGIQFAEVKASDGTLYSSYNQGQLVGMITAMATDPIIKEYGGDFLIGTTSDTTISQSFKDEAYLLNINVLHTYAKYRYNSEGQMEVNFFMHGFFSDNGTPFSSIIK